MPTLVLHRRHDQAVRFAAGRDMAGHITGAQFVELDGQDHWFFAGDRQPVLAALNALSTPCRATAGQCGNTERFPLKWWHPISVTVPLAHCAN